MLWFTPFYYRDPDMISLNVGGIMYMTTRSTQTSHSSWSKSKLQAMFGHPATELCPLDAQGNFFIDHGATY